MRHLAALAALSLLGALPLAAQDHSQHQQKGKAEAKHEMGKMDHMAGPWKEMNAFHKLLGATFHPVEKQKDTKALRQQADALAGAARAWAASTPPAACNAPEVKSTVATISTDALAIGNQVLAQATDAELVKAITSLHDKFEGVEKKCGGHDMKGMKH